MIQVEKLDIANGESSSQPSAFSFQLSPGRRTGRLSYADG
jgi:hypothetical protein